MGPFNQFTACMPEHTPWCAGKYRTPSAGIIWHICTKYTAPPGVQYIAVRGVSN